MGLGSQLAVVDDNKEAKEVVWSTRNVKILHFEIYGIPTEVW